MLLLWKSCCEWNQAWTIFFLTWNLCMVEGKLPYHIQYIPRNMHTVFALLCFVVVIHWLIFPYPSGLLHWHCGNLTIAPVPAKQLWWIWINTSCEFIMNDCITTTKQSTTKPCAYFLGYTVYKLRQKNKINAIMTQYVPDFKVTFLKKWCSVWWQYFVRVQLMPCTEYIGLHLII